MDNFERPDEDDRRRALVIAQLIEKAATSPDPERWIREFTVKALRTLTLGSVPAAERGQARLQIQTISKEVSRAVQAGRRM